MNIEHERAEDESAPLLRDGVSANNTIKHGPRRPTGRKFWSILPGLILGIMITQMDSIIELSAYSAIGSEYSELRHVSWLTLSYMVSVLIVQPIYSRLSDMLGRKAMALASYCLHAFGIVLCTVSQDFWFLCFARLVVGMGAGGSFIFPLIMNDLIPLRDRAIWEGVLVSVLVVGSLIGGPLGGTVTDRFGWRVSFVLELPAIAVAFVLVCTTLDMKALLADKYDPAEQNLERSEVIAQATPIAQPPATTPAASSRAAPFDYGGTLLLALSMIGLVLASNLAGNDLSWSHPAIAVLFAVFGLGLIAFVIYEIKMPFEALIPMNLLVQRDIAPVLSAQFFKSCTSMALMYLLPFYITVSGQGNVSKGGLYNAVVSVGEAMGQFAAGILIRKRLRPWDILTASSAITIIMAAVFQAQWDDTPHRTSEQVSQLIIYGLASGAIDGGLLVGLLKGSHLADKAVAFGVFRVAAALAYMITVSICSSIIQYQITFHLRTSLSGEEGQDLQDIIDKCLASLDCLENMTPAHQVKVRFSFAQSVQDCFAFVVVLVVLMSICCVFTKRYRLST